jgi:hypothetical protein
MTPPEGTQKTGPDYYDVLHIETTDKWRRRYSPPGDKFFYFVFFVATKK